MMRLKIEVFLVSSWLYTHFFLFLQAATKSFAETYARRTALSMTSAIVKVVTGLLIQARDCLEDEKSFEALNSAPIITKLMPHILASISSLAASDPPSAVQVLSFIQEILPSVASLQNLYLLNQVSDSLPYLNYYLSGAICAVFV